MFQPFAQHQRPSRGRGLRVSTIIMLVTVSAIALLAYSAWRVWSSSREQPWEPDAIIVPGGGQKPDGTPPDHVKPRLKRAIELFNKYGRRPPIIVLSWGTTHKPPPKDGAGFCISEATSGSIFLLQRGVPPEAVLEESFSKDTIGNAFFLRVMHTDVNRWQKLLIVNSEFHMPRTRSIFEFMFALLPLVNGAYDLRFDTVPNTGLDDEALRSRQEREKESLRHFEEVKGSYRFQERAMHEMHRFLFQEHMAYATKRLIPQLPKVGDPNRLRVQESDADDDESLLNTY